MKYSILALILLLLAACQDTPHDWDSDERLCANSEGEPYIQCYVEWNDGLVTLYGEDEWRARESAEMDTAGRWCEHRAVACD